MGKPKKSKKLKSAVELVPPRISPRATTVHGLKVNEVNVDLGTTGQFIVSTAPAGLNASVVLRGVPSPKSAIRRVEVSFVPDDDPLPQPVLNSTTGNLEIFYSLSHLAAVLATVRGAKNFHCWYWENTTDDVRGATLYSCNAIS